MPESKFTPGPWEVQDGVQRDGGLGYRIIGPGGFVVGFTQAAMCREDYFGFAKANAELMADAPRLLEVLRKVLTYAESSTRRQYLDEADQAFVEANGLLEKHGG